MLPKWVYDYLLPKEEELENEINQLNEKIKILQEALEEKQGCLLKFSETKILFTGTGNELEKAVERIFREL